MVAIINYNMGNLRSVENALSLLGVKHSIESDPERLGDYDRVILPGVGAFGDAMEHLQECGMDSAIKSFAKSGKPLLGICLGMQLLFEKSREFGEHNGLGLIDGVVEPFDVDKFDHKLKVPHMGWNELFCDDNPLFKGLNRELYLYFVHSFHVVCDESYAIASTHYGYKFTSAVSHGNIFGLQPHPEKSHNSGLGILKNFTNL